jgi:phosphatidylglycerol---prolipoprotein diacylglyceryl transferase
MTGLLPDKYERNKRKSDCFSEAYLKKNEGCMHPILIQFSMFGGEIIIGTYGVLVASAAMCAVLIALKAARRINFYRYDLFPTIIIILASALAGTMIAGIAVYFAGSDLSFSEYIKNPVIVSWGGIIGGIIAGLITCTAWKIDIPRFADACAPGYLLGIGIGRIGCFFGGCCYGVHTDSIIGVTFSHPLAAATRCIQPLVPTQLISAAYLITAGLVFFYITGKIGTKGRIFGLSAIIYSIGRFAIEFWRDDTRAFLFSLSDGQLFSVVFFTAGLFIFAYPFLKKKFFNNSGK